jgi:hypothetical protein
MSGRRLLISVAAAAALLAAMTPPLIRFEEVSQKAGVSVRHQTRRFGGKHGEVLRMFTSGGAAVAVGDYDNDGDEDMFVTDSDQGRPNRLYRNDGSFSFTETAEIAGVAGGNNSLAIVADALWFDYDNDGWLDLLVARFGTPLLYHNQRNGRFRDVSAASGLNTFANTIAAIAFDYDGDGRLDLLFGNYFKPVNLLDLRTPHVLPNDLDNAINGGGVSLWRNAGQGHFIDVTRKAGFGQHTGWTLDVGHGDIDNDGDQDVYLACDYGTDRLFVNNGDGRFSDVTLKSLGGFDTKKGMNAEVADYDNDGWLDIYVTNITDEYMRECNMLWHNNADGTFSDVSKETGTCETLWGWSAKFGDFDNDGWQDLFVTNGLRSAGKENYIPVLLPMITKPGIDFTDVRNWPDIGNRSWSGYQKKKMYRNLGAGTFIDISADASVDNDKDGRGLGIADFDNDGLLDIFQTNADQAPLFYRGRTHNAGNWLELSLVGGGRNNRSAIGARVTLVAGKLRIIREIDGGNGYSGQSSTRLHFGLGKAVAVDSLEVRWPDGDTERFNVRVNERSRIEHGRGVRLSARAARR